MEPLQRLLDIESIKQLKGRYLRCFDTKDWDGWLNVFTDDIVLEFSVSVGPQSAGSHSKFEGKQALAEFVIPYTQKAQTVHHGHTPEIEILSDSEARGVWAMEDIVDHHEHVIHGFGHYHETYRKVGGEWRIATVRLSRLRISKTQRDNVAL